MKLDKEKMDDKTNDPRSIFNERDLLQRLMGDTSLEKAVLAAFLTEIPELLQTLTRHVDQGDSINARLAVHTIRGAAANLSASNLRATAEQMEELCKKQDLDGCRSGVAVLEAEFDQFKDVIESLGLLRTHEEKA